MVDPHGGRHTMLGFDTEDEAAQWVEVDKRRKRLTQTGFLADAAD